MTWCSFFSGFLYRPLLSKFRECLAKCVVAKDVLYGGVWTPSTTRFFGWPLLVTTAYENRFWHQFNGAACLITTNLIYFYHVHSIISELFFNVELDEHLASHYTQFNQINFLSLIEQKVLPKHDEFTKITKMKTSGRQTFRYFFWVRIVAFFDRGKNIYKLLLFLFDKVDEFEGFCFVQSCCFFTV